MVIFQFSGEDYVQYFQKSSSRQWTKVLHLCQAGQWVHLIIILLLIILLADDVENRDFLCKLLEAMYEELPAPKKRK